PLRERVPGRAVDHRHRRPVVLLRRDERDAMRRVRVEVDARDVPERAALRVARRDLVTLEEERPAVVVARVGAREAVLEHEVGVLVGLGLLRFERAGLSGRRDRRLAEAAGQEAVRRNHLRKVRVVGADDVVLVAVEARDPDGILERRRRSPRTSCSTARSPPPSCSVSARSRATATRRPVPRVRRLRRPRPQPPPEASRGCAFSFFPPCGVAVARSSAAAPARWAKSLRTRGDERVTSPFRHTTVTTSGGVAGLRIGPGRDRGLMKTNRVALVLAAAVAATAAGCGGSSGSGVAGQETTIDSGVVVGAGSTLVAPLVAQWTGDYARKQNVTITYGAIGS